MELSIRATQSGGENLNRIIERAMRAQRTPGVAVGFFASARYPDGTPVAHVAAQNEWGAAGVPERPFFRSSVRQMEQELMPTIRRGINTQTLAVDRQLANRVGAQATGIIQDTISNQRYSPNPPNSPETIERKGSSTPLIDTGRMRQSATWRVFG